MAGSGSGRECGLHLLFCHPTAERRHGTRSSRLSSLLVKFVCLFIHRCRKHFSFILFHSVPQVHDRHTLTVTRPGKRRALVLCHLGVTGLTSHMVAITGLQCVLLCTLGLGRFQGCGILFYEWVLSFFEHWQSGQNQARASQPRAAPARGLCGGLCPRGPRAAPPWPPVSSLPPRGLVPAPGGLQRRR